ncbi:unnamed protein product [Schistosoma margrebowiei]|uniref:Uncharacterized protein n=1 Tax=Schistosoma margrebowiei TaxID=48269 RepID=A0A183MHQ6_9TREM|nr:unnamed protein product [Schistosoma margrebowiei]
MSLLTTRATIYLGTWNVRTMWDTGRAFQIAAEMRRYNLEVLGISETRWTQVGQQRLTSGELLLYSGHEKVNAPHTQGVALMLSKQAQNTLIGWESHGPRIIKASFKTKKEGITMKVIQCYAFTNDYNEDAKDQFYDRLQSITEKCPTKDLTKVGTDNTGYEDIMGRHRLEERNVLGMQRSIPIIIMLSLIVSLNFKWAFPIGRYLFHLSNIIQMLFPILWYDVVWLVGI